MKVLVTGARGFVGSSFGQFACAHGHEVLGVSRTSQAAPDWLGGYAWADAALSDLTPIVNGFRPDLVVHCAGSASVSASLVSPLDDLRATVLTFANTLESIRRSEVRPLIIFPSSAAVYGNPRHLPVREDAACHPISPYGFHKLAAEQLVHEYVVCHQLRAVVCRIFSLVGQRQRRLLLWDLYQQFIGPSEEVLLQGMGDETRDYLHIDDLSETFLKVSERGANEIPNGSILNVASGIETSIHTLASLVKEILGSSKKIIFSGRPRPGDPTRWVADCDKLNRIVSGRRISKLAEAIETVVTSWSRVGGRSEG
jgi:nucleoside-diphosphate-sugar epimerase